MSRKDKETRRARIMAANQHGGLDAETERTGVQSRNKKFNCSAESAQRRKAAERRRRELQCRAYWRRVYGADVEAASRGGVQWMGGGRYA